MYTHAHMYTANPGQRCVYLFGGYAMAYWIVVLFTPCTVAKVGLKNVYSK